MRKVAAIHDLSCYGRCSLAVILPVLSVMGMQCCPLPGTVLSTHTGGFGPVQRTDLTGQVDGTLRHWEELGLRFDGIYTGYMASAAQIHQAMEAVERMSGENTQVVVDPVLGDHGKLYTSITPEMAQAMGDLCQKAQVITPNLTEAAILLGLAPDALLDQRGEDLAVELSGQGQRSVVVTGVTPEPGYTGAVWFDHTTGASGTTVAVRAPGGHPPPPPRRRWAAPPAPRSPESRPGCASHTGSFLRCPARTRFLRFFPACSSRLSKAAPRHALRQKSGWGFSP